MTITILPLVLVCACADERTGAPEPVRRDEVASTVVTTTTAAPPSTKPLVTAPPSPLLDEVVAAYDAAYADLLAAEAIPDEHYPALGNHIAGEQLDVIRELIGGLRSSGLRGRPDPTRPGWRRVEAIRPSGDAGVVIEVCRFDPTEAVNDAGVVVDPATRPFRHEETMRRQEGAWRWTGRAWLDDSPESDCALPS